MKTYVRKTYVIIALSNHWCDSWFYIIKLWHFLLVALLGKINLMLIPLLCDT